jgi:hypothetical protein
MSRRGTRRILNFTPKQLKSLRNDGQYKSRHINAFSDMGSNYNDIKNTENYQRSLHPDISQKKLAAKTFKIFKEENLGSSPTPINSSSSGTRRSRRGSSSSGTRSRRSRRGSSSSGTRSRRRRGSSSSGTRGRRRRGSRSLHTSDL